MTVPTGGRRAALPDPASAFVPVEAALGSCRAAHTGRRGKLDESARRLSHEELNVAERLVAEGHAVRSVPEGRRRGRSADLEVCGVPVEVKSWLSLSDREGVPPGWRSVVNKLISAEGQGQVVVLSAAGSGLSPIAAATGIARYAAERPASEIQTIRAIGDGFDLAWARTRVMERSPAIDRRLDLGVSM